MNLPANFENTLVKLSQFLSNSLRYLKPEKEKSIKKLIVPNYLQIMTDEALFDLTGYSNSQTEREWFPQGTGGNPFFLKEMSIPQGKIMIWVGFIGKY